MKALFRRGVSRRRAQESNFWQVNQPQLFGDESLLAVGFENGRVLVWHLPSRRLAGLVDNTDWELEGSLANDEDQPWVDPPPPRSGSTGIIVGKPYRGKKLTAIGFEASNQLIGISLHPNVAWVWKADPKWFRADDGGAP